MPVPRPTTTPACPDCGEPMARDGRCRGCDGAPGRHNRWRLFYGGVGTVLTLSVVFAPVGIPMLLAADHHRRQASGGRDAPGLLAHARAVIRSHVDLSAPTRRDFTRGGARYASAVDLPPEL